MCSEKSNSVALVAAHRDGLRGNWDVRELLGYGCRVSLRCLSEG